MLRRLGRSLRTVDDYRWPQLGSQPPPGQPPPGQPPGSPSLGSPPVSSAPFNAPKPSNVGAIVAAAFVGVAVVAASIVGSVAGWGVDQVGLIDSGPPPRWMWPLVGVVVAVLVSAPTALLA